MNFRPKMTELEPGEREVLQRLWEHFKKHRSWPNLAERLRIEFDEKGKDFDTVRKQWLHIHVNTSHDQKSHGQMSAGLDDLLYLPEVRELLAPLPHLFKLAAERLKERPTYKSNLDQPRIMQRDLESIWGNVERAGLVADLFEQNHLEMLSSSGRDQTGPHFSPRVEILRYEDVSSLEEIEQLPEREPLPELTIPPKGIYLKVLRALHDYCQREFCWPAPVRFVTEQLELGYTATVLKALHPDFIAAEPYFFGKKELELTVSCIKWVASGHEQHLLVELIQEMVEQYKKDPREHRVSLSELAGRLSQTVELLAPLLKYLHHEPWGSVEEQGAPPGEWLLFWDERIFEFRKVDDWDGYLKKRDELAPGRLRKRSPSYSTPAPLGKIRVEAVVGSPGGSRPQAVVAAELPKRLFISFASPDASLAHSLSEWLHRGCRVPEGLITCTAWNDIEGGEDIPNQLRTALRDSVVFLPLVSADYFQSTYAVLELGAAWGQEKAIIPVLVPPMRESGLKAVLAHKKGYPLDEPTSLDKLGTRIQRELKTEPRIDDWGKQRDRFLREIAGELVQRRTTKK